jgi:hypothetical protein
VELAMRLSVLLLAALVGVAGPCAAARAGGTPLLRASVNVPRYTCGAAAVSVTEAGYAILRRLDCSGRVFAYAARRDGATYRVAVEAVSGRVLSIRLVARGGRRFA